MSKVALMGGAYQARSLIANAQRCVNLYPELDPGDSPFPTTHYPTPGLTLWSAPPFSPGAARGAYRATNNLLYVVVEGIFYEVSSSGVFTSRGFIDISTTPVSMVDNGIALVLVDGTEKGYALDISPDGQILTQTFVGGTGYSDGAYTGIALTGGSGTGATADVTVSGGVVTAFTLAAPGMNYHIGDVLTSTSIGSGTGFGVTVVTISIQNSFAQIEDPAFFGSTRVDYLDTFFIFNRPGTNQFYISLSNASFEMLTQSVILSGVLSFGGSGQMNGNYISIPLTGGFGTGAVADVTVLTYAGPVTSVLLTNPGHGYRAGDILSGHLGGQILNGNLVGGAGYTDGNYSGLLWNGGHGSTAGHASTTIVSGGAIIGQFPRPGIQYQVGDVLTPSSAIGLGSGASFTVTVIYADFPGSVPFQYTLTQVGSQGFDSLDIAAKTGYPDQIVACIVMHREIWLIGQLTTEVWYNTGAADFTFGIMPGVFIEHGCVAPYSICKQDLNIFWLSQDLQGQAIVIMGAAYQAKRISTHAIEAAIQAYAVVSDAIGFTYQEGGHVFYQLTFPTANATWVFDVTTELWHQRASMEAVNGTLNRHRANCAAFAYGLNLVGDFENGTFYIYDQNNYTENGVAMPRIRSFPHIQSEDNRLHYKSFTVDMEVGTLAGSTTDDPPMVSLRWSNDRGASWGNAVEQSLGSAGEYLTSIQWNRLGMARDRVFELSWSAATKTALNGAYIDARSSET